MVESRMASRKDRSMREAAVFGEGAKKDSQGSNQQPGTALEQLNNAPTDKEGKQGKNQNGRGKFHWH